MAEASDSHSITPEELQAALRQYVPERTLERERDMLAGRYRIMPAEPIAELSSSMAKAFVARDVQATARQLYALVFDTTALPRKKNILALKEFRHPHLLALLEEGVAEISIYSESRYVVIMERPSGQSLSELLSSQQKNPVLESTVISHLLRPFTELLKAFQAMGISHNRINLSNVYLTNGAIQLGECISEPSGFSQDFLFEPIDRVLTSPWGKPDYAIDADCYAVGMLALHMLLGFQPFANVTKEDFIDSLLTKGSYHSLVIQWDISEHMQDLFRALLNNAKRDRCAPEHIEFWLTGKSFNLILPSLMQETARGFDFAGRSYLNRKALAHALFTHWEAARVLLFDTKLQRWLETGLHKKELADAIGRIAGSNMGDSGKAEKHNNELLARIIMMLDPLGPVRFKTLSFAPEAIGTMLAHAYFSGNQNMLQELYQAIEGDLGGWWIEQQKALADYSVFAARLQKARTFLRMRGPGFGIERCLYDFHPLLMCQSPLIKRFCVISLPDMFTALDMASVNQRASETDFMDTHIAAFIASRLELSKEIRIHELEIIAELAANPRLVSLKLLARVQHNVGNPSARGLSYWIGLRLYSMLDYIHKRSVRQKMQNQLQAAAASGKVGALSSLLLNPDIFVSDYHSFKKAEHIYAVRQHQIARLNDPRERQKHARMVGRGLAQTLAYGSCLFTMYFTLRAYYHF